MAADPRGQDKTRKKIKNVTGEERIKEKERKKGGDRPRPRRFYRKREGGRKKVAQRRKGQPTNTKKKRKGS